MSPYATTLVHAWLPLKQIQLSVFVEDKPVDIDAERMLAVARGEDSAFNGIIKQWQRPLLNFFYRNTGNATDAEDLAQLVFVRLYRAAPRYKPTARFSTYLFQIARRLLLNHYRSQKRKPLDPVDPADLHDRAVTHPHRDVWELEDVFTQALQTLPEKQRTALLLLVQQELSYEEIANTMDASISAIKTWIYRARQHMKSSLQEANAEQQKPGNTRKNKDE